jgi:hypothetical protein
MPIKKVTHTQELKDKGNCVSNNVLDIETIQASALIKLTSLVVST